MAKCDSAPNALHFSVSPKFGGLEDRWTPQDCLLAAIASCFTATFRVLAARRGFEYLDLEVEVRGLFQNVYESNSSTEIAICARLTILREEDHRTARVLLNEAHLRSPVGLMLAIKGGFEPHVQLATSRELRDLE
jgi:uncharacterized OsmC-like protein